MTGHGNHDDPDAQDLHDLADTLWRAYPDRAGHALLKPSDTFPDGALLGRFTLDAGNPARTSGPPVDLFDEHDREPYTSIRRQLLARALHAAVLTDELIEQALEHIENQWCRHGWDEPWKLIGLVPTDAVRTHELPADPDDEIPGTVVHTVTAVPLVPTGTGHPSDALAGLIAPAGVFGLVLVNEGYEHDDAKRRIGEIRMFLVVLADGRWGFKHTRRHDSTLGPYPDSTIAGALVGETGRDEPFATSPGDAIAGRIPETLARVLQVAVETDLDPYETLLRLLANAAAVVALNGGTIDDIVRIDPATVAYVGATVVEHLADAFEQLELTGLVDEDAAHDAMRAHIDTLHARAGSGGDWLDDQMLAMVTADHALHAAAGAYRAVEQIDDTEAAWLGSELLAGRAGELAGPTTASLTFLRDVNPALASRLTRIIEHRRAVWGITSDDTTGGVTMPLGGAPRRNAPCPCRSGRKFKHCCMGA